LIAAVVSAAISWTCTGNDRAKLTVEIRRMSSLLEALAARDAESGPIISVSADAVDAEDDDLSRTLQNLRAGVERLERRLTDLREDLGQRATARVSDGGGGGWPPPTAPIGAMPAVPGMAYPPRFSTQLHAPPGTYGINTIVPGGELSPISRDHVEEVMRSQAMRAKELIELESLDPGNPEPAELMRAMQYSSEEAIEALRARLSPHEFRAMFPVETDSNGTHPD
jgi:hypothetical protein